VPSGRTCEPAPIPGSLDDQPDAEYDVTERARTMGKITE
jgi:hypothetical protein